MKVFLRSKKTRLYLAGSNGWAAEAENALAFASVPQATSFALDDNVPEVEVVVRFDLLPDEVVVPVVPAYRDFGQPGSAPA